MNFLRLLLAVAILSLLTSCTTTPELKPTGKYGTFQSSPNALGQYNKIDLELLAIELKMADNPHQVGFEEKAFDACKVNANVSDNPACDRLYLGILRFQMVCRTNDAIVKRSELQPLKHKDIRWKRGYLRGLASTDDSGFGKIQFVSDSPSKFRPMIMRMHDRVVFKRLKDQWQMVLPNHWCDWTGTKFGSSSP